MGCDTETLEYHNWLESECVRLAQRYIDSMKSGAVRERPSQCGKGSWQGITHGVYNSCADMPSRIPSLRFVAIALMGGFLWWISYDLED